MKNFTFFNNNIEQFAIKWDKTATNLNYLKQQQQ